ncbi:site-specific integrase [Pontibaca salina]|uniref:Site-specific integrase n=1 Tax=Pontibaca salina TaxID=2795731 RepID=A0A934HT42_9RHOB|nr:site-specific integrase [Pontibaca salina]MBI6630366.1 site-specific integrase [Pontibaca salina]
MTVISKINLDTALLPKGTLMFADLIALLAKDPSLSATRRRDLMSGLRRVAKALGQAPQNVPADSRWLQPRLAKRAPAALGLSPKSWQNAVSDARAAMVHARIVERRSNHLSDLSSEWQALWTSLLAAKDKTLQPALCRFVHFLNNQGIGPDQVTAEHALAYRDALAQNEISKSPDGAYRAAVNGWNLAVQRLPDWPKTTHPLESRQKIIKLPEAAFSAAFLQDLERLMARLANPDPLADEGRARALRPATLNQYRRQIIRFASELVHAGLLLDAITEIAVLLAPANAERGLRQMLTRTENKSTKLIGETAALLRNLGRITGQPEEVQKKLADLAARLAPAPQRGMTRKNRDRLRILQNEESLQRLLHLPDRLFAHPPAGKTNTFTKALAREDAVAIAILLVCPIRIKNLAGIHLELHLQRPGDGRAFLVLSEDDLKNERPLEFELPIELIRMIDRHLASRSPELCPAGTAWLFPRRDGAGSVSPGQLSARISKRVRKETGFEINAHLFRHFAVMTWLDANPGSYEVARRLLGHSEVSHTINMYSGLEVKSATRIFADLIETKKGRRT